MIAMLPGLFLSITSGFLIVRLLLPETMIVDGKHRPTRLLGGFLAPGLGLGISACVYFLWLVTFNQEILLWLDLALVGLLLILVMMTKRAGQPQSTVEPVTIPFLRMGFFVAVALSIAWFVLYSLGNPHGDWDAWAIWNMRARFLERGGSEWQTAFNLNLAWSHPDYPLLIPASVARLWSYASDESTFVPVLVAGSFIFGTVGILYASLRDLVSRSQAMLAVVVLLGCPHFVKAGAAQQADIPVAFFFLASAALLHFHDHPGGRQPGLMFLVGTLAGLAAWTKNEGLLLVPALLLARLLIVPRIAGWKTFTKESFYFILGAIPVLIVVFYFKLFVAPPSELLLADGLGVALRKIADPSRYLTILISYAREITFLGMSLPLLLYGFLAGGNRQADDHRSILILIFTFVFVALGHIAVYLITPYDIQWHINTSLNRLLLQLWPVAVFITFLSIRTPEQVLGNLRKD